MSEGWDKQVIEAKWATRSAQTARENPSLSMLWVFGALLSSFIAIAEFRRSGADETVLIVLHGAIFCLCIASEIIRLRCFRGERQKLRPARLAWNFLVYGILFPMFIAVILGFTTIAGVASLDWATTHAAPILGILAGQIVVYVATLRSAGATADNRQAGR